MLTRCRAIDLETTGWAEKGGRICEIGWSDVLITSNGLQFPCDESRLVNPWHPIPPEASAIHHIMDADVVNCPAAPEVVPDVLQGGDIFIAHNAEFERGFLRTDRPWVCTMKVAMRLLPESSSQSLQYFRYRLGLDLDRRKANPPHRAGPDAYVTARLFAELLKSMSIEKMLEVSLQPVLLHLCETGKYRGSGMTWGEVAHKDPQWVQYVMRNEGGMFNENVVYTAARCLRGKG